MDLFRSCTFFCDYKASTSGSQIIMSFYLSALEFLIIFASLAFDAFNSPMSILWFSALLMLGRCFFAENILPLGYCHYNPVEFISLVSLKEKVVLPYFLLIKPGDLFILSSGS